MPITVAQGKLDFDPPVVSKRVRATSVEAVRALAPTLPFRESMVMWNLVWAARAARREPTAYELLKYMQRRPNGPLDVNCVRPRLTELTDKGLVEPCGKRLCEVTGRRVHTWRLTELASRALSHQLSPALSMTV